MLAGFPQHIMRFVVHALPHRWSMSGTVDRILFDNAARLELLNQFFDDFFAIRVFFLNC